MTILWADDEIDLLKPHILFLKQKGYDVVTAMSGTDALDLMASQHFDLVILDENMPGITGLETLQRIKLIAPATPVIMITKSEEENIMNQAVGAKIADYLIKPVNPNQILLSIKKNLHSSELVSDSASENYRREFADLTDRINRSPETVEEWKELYRRLVYWDIELSAASTNMDSILMSQFEEANITFAKYIRRNYEEWIKGQPGSAGRPMLSPELFSRKVFPLLDKGEKVCFVLIDNFRLDQWQVVRPVLSEYFTVEDDDLYMSILPTATQYARNAIFSGLMPAQIRKMFPDLWIDEDEDESKNLNESPLIATQFERYRRKCRFSYHKINDSAAGEKLARDFKSLRDNDLNVVVINFIDMLSHARTESKMIRELASTNAAYRSLTLSWFKHSSVSDLLKRMTSEGAKIILTTDHGTIRVTDPQKVVGDKNTNTNLRYKVGKNLSYNPKRVFEMKKPELFGLPSPNVSSAYIFATGKDFFAYPNNYNHYVQYYTDTFQHGGISLEEMLVPVVTLSPK